MQTVELGNTGEIISCMGLGTMYFGSKVDKNTSFDILDIYAGYGGEFLDSANKYASWVPGFKGGESEHLIGDWMKERRNRQKIFLSSKVGFPYGEIPHSLKKRIIISECEKSLKRLAVETIDIYFAHTYDPETPIEETMEAFYRLKKEGKVRFLGASNFPAWRMEEANNCSTLNGWEEFCCLQQRHTYLQPNIRAEFGNQLILTPEIEDYALSKNITLMGYSPLLNSSYVNKRRKIPEQYDSLNTKYGLEVINTVAGELNATANQVVLRWMMNSNPVVIPIISGSNKQQIIENLESININFAENHMKILNELKIEQYRY